MIPVKGYTRIVCQWSRGDRVFTEVVKPGAPDTAAISLPDHWLELLESVDGGLTWKPANEAWPIVDLFDEEIR